MTPDLPTLLACEWEDLLYVAPDPASDFFADGGHSSWRPGCSPGSPALSAVTWTRRSSSATRTSRTCSSPSATRPGDRRRRWSGPATTARFP